MTGFSVPGSARLSLVLDTSTPAVTAALVHLDAVAPADGGDGVTVLAQYCLVDARGHGERLAPAVEAVLAQGGARPTDLSAIVAGLGPGPFTGLRVGLVTAAAMAQALAIPTYGVCSLDGIGATLPGSVLVATDARRKEVYWAVYDDGVRVTEPSVNRPAEIPQLIEGALTGRALTGRAPDDRDKVTMAAGDGAHRYAVELGLPVADQPRYPCPQTLVACAADRVRAGMGSEVLRPLYLRRPDAVEPTAARSGAQP